MRITKLRTTPVAVPFRTDEIWAFGRRRGQASVLLELETDEGVIGLGEAATYPSTDIVLAVFRSLEPLVIGSDPFRIEQLVRRIDVVGTWHHVGYTSPAMAAVEMACWDIVGKVAGQPLVPPQNDQTQQPPQRTNTPQLEPVVPVDESPVANEGGGDGTYFKDPNGYKIQFIARSGSYADEAPAQQGNRRPVGAGRA